MRAQTLALLDGGNERRLLWAPTNSGGLESPHLITDASGATTAAFVYAGRKPLMRLTAIGPQYYLEDGLGSVIGVTDGTGQKTGSQDFDAFGNIANATGALSNGSVSGGGEFAFQGSWREAATGLYHLRARDYDPRVGRFISRDAAQPNLRIPESLHSYAFANSNPQLYSDPTGQFSLVEISVSNGIQVILQGFKTEALREGRNYLMNKVGEVLANSLIDGLRGFLPESVRALVTSEIELDPAKAKAGGTLFDLIMQSTLCKIIPNTGGLWFVPEVTTAGDVVANGLNCGSPGSQPPSAGRGNSLPDFIFMKRNLPPTNPRTAAHNSAWVIGDFKISGNTLVKAYINPNTNPNQFEAITNYAKKHGQRVSLFITLWPANEQSLHLIHNLMLQTSMKKGEFVLIFSLF